MLHRCDSCKQLYLTSEFIYVCNYCGEQRQRLIERVSESDGAVEWWQVAVVIASGEQMRRQRRWEVR